MLSRIADFLYPNICLRCEQVGENGLNLCAQCYEGLAWNSSSCGRCALPLPSGNSIVCGACSNKELYFDYAIAPFIYKDFMQEVIQLFKFNQKFNYGSLLADLFCQSIEKANLDLPDILLPVPLHKKRIKARGYNQSLELASMIGKKLKIEVYRNAVKRIRETHVQMQLPAKYRVNNDKNAFAINSTKEKFKNKHIAIVDDVMTTGNTVNEVAKCVRSAGAARVDVWCMVRVD